MAIQEYFRVVGFLSLTFNLLWRLFEGGQFSDRNHLDGQDLVMTVLMQLDLFPYPVLVRSEIRLTLNEKKYTIRLR